MERGVSTDNFGDIVILTFPDRFGWLKKRLFARRILKKNKNVKTVLEKTGKISGRLRTFKTKHLAGEKTKVANYKENGCVFKFNVDDAYFSPRLSNERKEIAEEVLRVTKRKKKPKILVMFAGIAPYPIILAKKFKEAKRDVEIYSNELNRKANKIAEENVRLNKLEKYIKFVSGDAKRIPDKISEKFDVVVMPRPNLNETFLDTVLKLSKKGTVVFYHGFGTKENVLKEIRDNAKDKIRRVSIKKAGDIGPRIFRWRAKFKIL